jgi:hypothetical protein
VQEDVGQEKKQGKKVGRKPKKDRREEITNKEKELGTQELIASFGVGLKPSKNIGVIHPPQGVGPINKGK